MTVAELVSLLKSAPQDAIVKLPSMGDVEGFTYYTSFDVPSVYRPPGDSPTKKLVLF